MSTLAHLRPLHLLLVEDNPGDVLLVREVLASTQLPHHLDIAPDGGTALAWLRTTPEGHAHLRADLVLLDLDLPGDSGRELLMEIKSDPLLRRTPVIVLSANGNDAELMACYGDYANCFLPKPLDLDKFVGLVQALRNYWLRLAVRPTHMPAPLDG
jgi:CheY-like chemotaxis protein